MSIGDMMILLKVRRGQYSIVEEKIAPKSVAIGKEIKELILPDHCVISGIIRHTEMILPRGTTVLEEGDEVFALVDDNGRQQLAKLLGRPQ
jgi:trk system potassium uptake protein TrkA